MVAHRSSIVLRSKVWETSSMSKPPHHERNKQRDGHLEGMLPASHSAGGCLHVSLLRELGRRLVSARGYSGFVDNGGEVGGAFPDEAG